ncbi:MAG: HalOD1 output domain-containing protein [Haloferacaceae archaeon]
MNPARNNLERPSGIVGKPDLVTQCSSSAPDDLTHVVLDAVATVAGVDPIDIDQQIYDVVDLDAIGQLFPEFGASDAPSGHVQFDFYGRRVVVYDDGTVEVYDEAT